MNLWGQCVLFVDCIVDHFTQHISLAVTRNDALNACFHRYKNMTAEVSNRVVVYAEEEKINLFF